MGGTFDPIHMGHLLLAEEARKQVGLEKIIFMPSGQSYMKQERKVLSADQRLKLVELSTQDTPYFEVSDMEILRGGYTYTYETLEILVAQNPDIEYYFILGADSLFSIERWKCVERIFENCWILAAARDKKDIFQLQEQAKKLAELYGAKIVVLNFPQVDISSTQIRESIKKHEPVKDMLHDKALEYILENKLYTEE